MPMLGIRKVCSSWPALTQQMHLLLVPHGKAQSLAPKHKLRTLSAMERTIRDQEAQGPRQGKVAAREWVWLQHPSVCCAAVLVTLRLGLARRPLLSLTEL